MTCKFAYIKAHELRCDNEKSENYKKTCILSRCPHKEVDYIADMIDTLRKSKRHELADYIQDKYKGDDK